MIAGTKADVVIIIEKIRLNYEIQFWDNTWHGSKHGIDCQKMFLTQLASQIDSMCKKLALEALQEIRIKYRWQAIDQEMKL
jgi:hypothetical protein